MTAPDRRWLFGPVPDLLFGCGLLYAAFFLLQTFAGDQMREVFPIQYQPFLALALGTPHYGATLLRVYERAEDRRRYAIFAVYVTIALAVAFVVGLRVPAFGSLLVTIYFTWSPWHYSGQNYGVALMFLRRRGVAVTPAIKRSLYASFLLSFALVVLLTHGVDPSVTYAPGSYSTTVYRFIPIGIPYAGALFAACAVGYGAVTLTAAALLLRTTSPRDLAPTAALIGLQALWFAAPACARRFGVGAEIDPFLRGAYAFLWVSMGHFVQYLWITTYYAALAHPSPRKAVPADHARFFAKALMAGVAIWILPRLVFAPGALGGLPDDLGLGILAAAVVNIHHFVLDGAIWKLREGPIARVLLRAEPEPETARSIAPTPGRSWPARVAWAGGAFLLLLAVAANVEDLAFASAAQRGDLARARAAAERLRWMGRGSPEHHIELARLFNRDRNPEQVRAELERSIDVYPTAQGWRLVGAYHEVRSDWFAALSAHQRALEIRPDFVPSLVGSARSLAALTRRDEALAVLERAAAIDPHDASIAEVRAGLASLPAR